MNATVRSTGSNNVVLNRGASVLKEKKTPQKDPKPKPQLQVSEKKN